METYIEVWRPTGREPVRLEGDRLTVGADPENDLTIDDPGISRLHAVLERFAAGWSIRDMGSRNGTFVNGERIASDTVLTDGDEVLVGHVRMVLRGPARVGTPTQGLSEPPRLTPRERDVLLELCRPLLGGDAFTEPASVADIARALVVTEAAVKQHVANLYDKFDLTGEDRKRVRLANVALQTGAVSLADLRPQ